MDKRNIMCVCRNISLDKVEKIIVDRRITIDQAIKMGIFGDMCQMCVKYIKPKKVE